ncbi:RNA polymerase sigma factor [Clostridium phoceensis]|uniref:RNA polymerase sigma factor n=1 Tax=Clostridium phoceensis TaxID=1650661 RepID=UPI0034C6292A
MELHGLPAGRGGRDPDRLFEGAGAPAGPGAGKGAGLAVPGGGERVPQPLAAAEAAPDRAAGGGAGGGRAPGGAGPAAGDGAEGPGEREILYLIYYEGFSTRETASLLGISQTAVTTRLQRARKKLRERLEEEGRP